MDTETEKVIEEQLKKLPANIKQAIANIDMSSYLQELGTKYNLHIDQLGTLSTEIWLVMLGLETFEEFSGNLRKNVGLREGLTESITQDINQRIFLNIRAELQEIQESQKTATLDTDMTENLNREDVLQGIEEPHKASTDTTLSQIAVPLKPPTPPPSDLPIPETAPNKAPLVESMGVNILEDKFNKMVHLPKTVQTVTVPTTEPKTPIPQSTPPAPKGYRTDPYREPTN